MKKIQIFERSTYKFLFYILAINKKQFDAIAYPRNMDGYENFSHEKKISVTE